MDPKTIGLPCAVYRHGSDTSLGGISSKHDSIVLLGIEGYLTLEQCQQRGEPVLVLDRSNPKYLKAVPLDHKDTHYSFGGNFLHTCDSRFSAVCNYPIPIHDRDVRKEDPRILAID